jgi:hypothetical protein
MTDLFSAEAIRDFQTVRALDFMTQGEQEELHVLTASYLKGTAASNFADVDPFETENYRRLRPAKEAIMFDGVREFCVRICQSRSRGRKKRRHYAKICTKKVSTNPRDCRPLQIVLPDSSSPWAVRSSSWCPCISWLCVRLS